MTVHADIVTVLSSGSPEPLGAVSNKVYPIVAPESATRPFVVYRKLSEEALMTLGGRHGMSHFVFAFECWGANYLEAINLAAAVRTAIEASPLLKPWFPEPPPPDDYEPPVDEFVETVIYSIWHA
jgi:hypothetical protein